MTVHDFGQANGFFYLLMEFVDGVNLRQAMKAGRFTPAQALAIVPKICEALQFAHNEGVLHRDIKPENILLDTRGRVKIADFGIAKLIAGPDTPASQPGAEATTTPTGLTQAGKALGTPPYMAPEQLQRPQDVDQRADIYSLGVVFYEMLTGELPVGRFAPPSQKSGADPRVDEVVRRTLEQERERRYQQASEVKTDVETIAGGPAASAGASTPPRKPGSSLAVRRPFGLPWALLIVAAIFMYAGCSSVWGYARELLRQPNYGLYFDAGILAVPIGVGLLRRRPWWRFAALVVLSLALAACVLLAILMLTGRAQTSSTWLGHAVTGPAAIWLCGAALTLVFAFLLWMFRVLVRPDVTLLFPRGHFVRPWIEWAALAGALVVSLGLYRLFLETGLARLNSILTRASFGPAVGRVLYVNRPDKTFLDFRTADYVNPPKDVDLRNWSTKRLWDWFGHVKDPAAMAALDRGEIHLALCRSAWRFISNRGWNRPWLLDAYAVAALTNRVSGTETRYILAHRKAPATWAFRGRDHIAGLVQILGYTENPPGVKIRYKLLRDIDAKPNRSGQ